MSPAPPWTLTEFRGRAGLDVLEADWRRIYAAMAERTALLSFEACSLYVDHYLETPGQLRCLALGDGERTRAICVLEPRTERRLGFPVPTWGALWLKGGNEAEVLCADPEARRALIPVLVAHLRRHPEGRSLLTLGPVRPDSPIWEGLAGLKPGAACLEPHEGVRVIDCSRPYPEFVAGLSRNSRKALKSHERRLAALDGARFERAREREQRVAAFERFMELEASGWKGRAGSAVRCQPGSAGFHAALAADLDDCEMLTLHADGRCLAATLLLHAGTACSGLKIAYDEAYAHLSPGNLVMAKAIELCCADPETRVLDLVGDSPWARNWSDTVIPQQLVHIGLGGVRGAALKALLRLRLGPLRRLARRLQGAPEGQAGPGGDHGDR
jgi:hypothetical protein